MEPDTERTHMHHVTLTHCEPERAVGDPNTKRFHCFACGANGRFHFKLHDDPDALSGDVPFGSGEGLHDE